MWAFMGYSRQDIQHTDEASNVPFSKLIPIARVVLVRWRESQVDRRVFVWSRTNVVEDLGLEERSLLDIAELARWTLNFTIGMARRQAVHAAGLRGVCLFDVAVRLHDNVHSVT